MATSRLTAEEVCNWEETLDMIGSANSIPKTVLGIAGVAPDHDIDTFYDGGDIPVYMSGSGSVVFGVVKTGYDESWHTEHSYFDNRPSIQGKKADLIIQDELWTCPYCYALNYVKVGHCHHCAGPRR